MELKKRTETIHNVEYGDLDAFIKEACGFDWFECQQIEEWGNDSQHRFKVGPITDDFHKKEWEKIKATKEAGSYTLRTILGGLCSDGKLEAGVYLISVCW